MENITIPISEYNELKKTKIKLMASLQEYLQEFFDNYRESLPVARPSRNLEASHLKYNDWKKSAAVDESSYISDKEKKIISYLREHPNISKQDLVKHLKGTYSHMTVLKNLDTLAKYDMIKLNQDPQNRWSYNITVNEESLLVQVIRETEQIKNNFLTVLEKLDEIITEYDPLMETPQRGIIFFLTKLLSLHRDITDRYFGRILIEWYKKTKDTTILMRAYAILFFTLSSILTRLSSTLQRCSRYPRDYSILNSLLDQLPTISQGDFVNKTIDLANKFKVKEQVTSLFDTVWDILYDSEKYRYLKK